jgi:hypothetical protein
MLAILKKGFSDCTLNLLRRNIGSDIEIYIFKWNFLKVYFNKYLKFSIISIKIT